VREPDQTLKNTSLGKLPFFDFAANQAWANTATLALNLVSWIQLAALPDGHPAKAWDIKRWRDRLFATAGKIITRARRHQLLLPEPAPEMEPAPTQANQQATPDCPKTEKQPPISRGHKPAAINEQHEKSRLGTQLAPPTAGSIFLRRAVHPSGLKQQRHGTCALHFPRACRRTWRAPRTRGPR
jgi:hypothetical protein